MTVADLVEQASRAGLDADQIATLVAVEAPRLAARIERIYRVTLRIGQTVEIDGTRYTVAALPAQGSWDDAITLAPYGTPLTLVAADHVRPLRERVEPERIVAVDIYDADGTLRPFRDVVAELRCQRAPRETLAEVRADYVARGLRAALGKTAGSA